VTATETAAAAAAAAAAVAACACVQDCLRPAGWLAGWAGGWVAETQRSIVARACTLLWSVRSVLTDLLKSVLAAVTLLSLHQGR